MSGTRVVLISVALYRRRWRFWYACQWVEKSACWTFIYFALPSAVRFQGLGEWRKMGAGVSLLAAKALVGYACQRIGIASVQDYFSFCASPVQLSRAGWGGERGVGGSYA